LYRFGNFVDGLTEPYQYPNVFEQEQTTGPDRLKIGATDAHSSLLYQLAGILNPPFYLLFVLHVSRCDQPTGRYTSPDLQWDHVNGFFAEHIEFLEADARYDLWIHSVPENATLVWDRHNLIFAYGPLDEFRRILLREGLEECPVEIPVPHTHFYHPELDDFELRILNHFDWRYTPLTDADLD
jgi:hypothetical protein